MSAKSKTEARAALLSALTTYEHEFGYSEDVRKLRLRLINWAEEPMAVSRRDAREIKDLVCCETTAAISMHIRLVGTNPVNYSGHPRGVETLCGSMAGWDTVIPLNHSTCRVCLGIALKMTT